MTRSIAILLLLILFHGFVLSLSSHAEIPGERNLGDFANDDGSHPDGTDSPRDDSSAMRRALAAGPGIVRIGTGHYRFGDIQIPAGVSVIGAGKSTVIRPAGAANAIFQIASVNDWELRDMVLEGESTGKWEQRKDAKKIGLSTSGCWGFEIVGVTARNFSGTGFAFSHTNLGEAAFSDGGRLERLVARGNYIGIAFDTRGEYITATHLNCRENVTGCAIHAGNTNISASNFCGNTDGMIIVDKENGSHGSISNCLFNHNTRYALWARAVEHGMAIDNCCFFYGTIFLDETTGVQITSGLVSCHVKTTGEKSNRFAGNYIIPGESWTFEFSEKTIVEDNFTKEGAWQRNR
ncbi:MAG: hypothetical protein ACKVT0_10870 [Planctomycetaceae bacterium]